MDNVVSSIDNLKYLSNQVNPIVFKVQNLPNVDVLRQILSDSVEGDTVLDGASVELRAIRKDIITANTRLQSRLNSYMKGGKYSQYLQDSILTQRQDRYVIPVKIEYRANVEGLIHDQSSTGSTVYIEPFEIVESNNQLKVLYSRQEIEIVKVLRQLSNQVTIHCNSILDIYNRLVELDVLFAKAEYSIATNSIRPSINTTGIVDLSLARHPLLDPATVVPISIGVGGDSPILIISGPNTGGKTVSLKVVGLCCGLAACGIFVPCKQATLSVYSNVYCLMGDGQSIEQSLSTFSAHVSRLVHIVEHADKQSLILLDELGSGTDPQEGAALALGIIQHIQEIGSTCIVTSHYPQLKEYATTRKGVLNASMQFDQETLRPTYKLIMDVPGASFALTIADNLGMPKRILEAAYKFVSQDSIAFDKLLRHMQVQVGKIDRQQQELDRLQLQLDNKLSQLEFERTQYQNKLLDLKKKSQKIAEQFLHDTKQQAQDIVHQLKQKLQQADEQALFDARTLNNQLSNIKPNLQYDSPSVSPLTKLPIKGDKVLVINLNTIGQVRGVTTSGKVTVQLGNITINCDLSNLASAVVTNPKSNSGSSRKNKTLHASPKPDDTASQELIRYAELNIIGQKVFDGIVLLDEFVEQCIANGDKYMRIVHGKGSGALGRGIQQHLQHQRYVKQYRYGGVGEGETGVTIVELK
jgi:DNA mismatch repair protein MutS2